MKTLYIVNEAMSNYSDVVGVFDTEEEASDYILVKANENCDNEAINYEEELELQLSYFSIEKEEATLESLYPSPCEEGEFIQYGEDIIDTFYNGNFSQGVEQLKEIYVSANEFGNYIADLCDELGYENMSKFANNHFNYSFFISLGRELN